MKSHCRTSIISGLMFLALTSYSQKVGFLMDDFISDRWYSDKKYFTERVTELGGEVLTEVAYGDTAAQVILAKKLIDAGVKVLVVVPTDARHGRKIAELAAASNVPLLSYDRLILSKKISLYISYDNVKVGRLQAKYALDLKPNGTYILINGPISDNNAVMFKAGQEEVLAKPLRSGKIRMLGNFVMDDWGELGAWMKLEQYLAKGEINPDVVIAANDALAAGVIRALPKTLLGKTIVTGQDADVAGLKNILTGSQHMTVYKPIAPLARKAAALAMDLATGRMITGTTDMQIGALTVKAIFMEPVVVDKANLNQTVIKDGHTTMVEIEKN